MSELTESKAMTEVREWKRLRNDEVAGLPPEEALKRMIDLARERSRAMVARMEELKAAGVRLERAGF